MFKRIFALKTIYNKEIAIDFRCNEKISEDKNILRCSFAIKNFVLLILLNPIN